MKSVNCLHIIHLLYHFYMFERKTWGKESLDYESTDQKLACATYWLNEFESHFSYQCNVVNNTYFLRCES